MTVNRAAMFREGGKPWKMKADWIPPLRTSLEWPAHKVPARVGPATGCRCSGLHIDSFSKQGYASMSFERGDLMKAILGLSAAVLLVSFSTANAATLCTVTAKHGLRVHKTANLSSRVVHGLPRGSRVRSTDETRRARLLLTFGNKRLGWGAKRYLRCEYVE